MLETDGGCIMLLQVNQLQVTYRQIGHPPLHAVQGISFELDAGQSLGIVGESGCGKSSAAKAIIGLQSSFGGEIRFEGKSVHEMNRAERIQYRRSVQMVFQDAVGSLNPHMTVRQTLEEVLRVHRMVPSGQIPKRISELLELVSLPERVLAAYPREISGGQCQRVSFARCLALNPRVILADEPVSALDVSVQARILNLLRTLQKELNLAILLISHDLAVVRTICDRVCVMHKGRFVETGMTTAVLETPQNDYTKSLLSAVPDVNRALGSTATRSTASEE